MQGMVVRLSHQEKTIEAQFGSCLNKAKINDIKR
jgi:hypothetical protein